MLIDFEKIFDTISWNFFNQTLDIFDFGSSIKRWVATFYNGIKSCVAQNGIMSESFSPQMGCRRGDPISPYLFILYAEMLGI
jgi:hypothetical protein